MDQSGEFPKKGLLVLPIDDADLQIGRDRELLLAIRLLHHPRLVYLLTGDFDHLRENLTLEFLGYMTRLFSSQDEALIDESHVRARKLAYALVNKVLPPSHLLKMEKLTLREALEWLDKPFVEPKFSLRRFFKGRLDVPDDGYFLFRKLQQFQDQYANVSDLSRSRYLADFLGMIAQEEDPDEFTIGEVSEDRIVIHTFPGRIFPITRTYERYSPSEPIEVRAGIALEFYQDGVDQETRFVQASPLTLLALDLAAASAAEPHVYVHEHTPRIRSPQCLAWSIWKSESHATIFSWPSILADNPTELIKRAKKWAEAIRKLEIDERWVDRIAFTWIRLHLSWLTESDEQLPALLEPDSDIDEAWLQLIQFFKLDALNQHSSQWFKTELPLLTAPEYGLSENIQIRLFKVLCKDSETILATWNISRRKAIRESRQFERGQTPEDWIEIYTSSRADLREDSMEKLLKEVGDVFPNSPWYLEARSNVGKSHP